MKFASELECPKIFIESDSARVVMRLLNPVETGSSLEHLVKDCMLLKEKFESINFFHDRCDGNYIIHGLSSLAQCSDAHWKIFVVVFSHLLEKMLKFNKFL